MYNFTQYHATLTRKDKPHLASPHQSLESYRMLRYYSYNGVQVLVPGSDHDGMYSRVIKRCHRFLSCTGAACSTFAAITPPQRLRFPFSCGETSRTPKKQKYKMRGGFQKCGFIIIALPIHYFDRWEKQGAAGEDTSSNSRSREEIPE